LEVPAGQPMQVHQAIGSRKAGKRGGVSGRGLTAGTGSRRPFPQRPLCSRRPRRPASPARALLAAVGSTWRQSRCAITHAITEFEFDISPVSSSSRPHTGVGTRGTTSSTRRACCSSSVSRLGLSTASATSGISPLPRERSDRRRLPGARRTVPEQESAAARRDGSPRHQRFKRLKGALGVVGREVFPSRGRHHARHLLRNIRLPPPEPHRDAQFCPFVLGKRASDLCEGRGARDRHRATRRAALPPARRQAQCRLSCRGA